MAIDWRVRETVQSGDSATTEWVSHRVYHINKDGHYVHELKYGDTIAWEEYCGTYTRGTLPTGVASLSCTRTTKEPSIASGTISTDNTEVFNGDVLSFTATASAYWTVSLPTTSYTIESKPDELSRESTFNGVTLSGVSASRTMRTITFTKNAGISSVSVTYVNSSGVSTSTIRNTTGPVFAWDGATVTWTATTESGYVTSQQSGSFAAGSGNQTIAPTAVAIRTLKAIQGDGALSGPVFNVYRQSSPSGIGATGLLVTGTSGATETATVYDGDVLYVAITNPTIYGNNYYPTGNFVVSGDLKMKAARLSTGNRPSTAYSQSYSDSEALSSDMTKVHYASTNSNMNSVISPTSLTVADGDKVTLAYTTGSFGGFIIHMLVLGYAYAEDSGDVGKSINGWDGGSFRLHNGTVLTLDPLSEGYQGYAGVSYSLSDGADNIACLVSPYDMTETWNQTSSATQQALYEEISIIHGIEDIAGIHGCSDAQILMWIGCDYYESGFGGSVDAEQMMDEYGQPDVIIYYTANGDVWTLLEDNT